MLVDQMDYFSPSVEGLSFRPRLRGKQGARVYTTAQVSVPAGLRGACSGIPKSRNLASNREEAFQPSYSQASTWETPAVVFPFFTLDQTDACCCFLSIAAAPSKARQPRYNSRASNINISLCDSHERCCYCCCGCCCVCVSVRAHVYPTEVGTDRSGALSNLFVF